VTAFLLGLALAGGILLFLLCVVWVRWHVRDRRARSRRLQGRARRRDDLERAERRLRLNIEGRRFAGWYVDTHGRPRVR
jgi:hypothetical protein